MTVPRKLQGYRYLPLCLLVLSACALAETRDVRLHGPNGDGGACTETGIDADADADPATAHAAATKPAPAAKPANTTRIKPVVTARGSDDNGGVHAPRWHSFLPGMFR